MRLAMKSFAMPLESPTPIDTRPLFRPVSSSLVTLLRGLPHAFRDVSAEPGHTVAIDIDGPSGGRWTLQREEHRWSLWCGAPLAATTSLRLNEDAAWKLLFNALSNDDAARAIQIEGQADLGRALLRARSVIV